MALYALISPGGSPGVTTTALALALTWPRPVVVAECDPSGGDIVAGLYAGHMRAPRGLLGVAFEAGRGAAALAAELSSQLVPLDDTGKRKFLAGITDPRQAVGLSPAWPGIAVGLGSLGADVIADCGRLDSGASQPTSVLAEAAAVILVMRPTLRQVARARPRIDLVSQVLGGRDRLGLLLIGDGGGSRAVVPRSQHNGLRSGEIAKSLEVRVIGTIPDDIGTAKVLSDGEGRRTRLERTPLMRAAQVAGLAVGKFGRAGMPAELTVSVGVPGGRPTGTRAGEAGGAQ